jgi:hypothetical protein
MYSTILLVLTHLFLLIGTNFAAEIPTPVMKQTLVARQPQIEKQYQSVIIFTLSIFPH